MVLELKESTMASLDYKLSYTTLISQNQTHPPPFSSLKTRRRQPPPHIFFFFVLLLLFPSSSSLHVRRPPRGRRRRRRQSRPFSLLPSASPKTVSLLFPSCLLLFAQPPTTAAKLFPAIHGGQTTGRGKAPSFLGFNGIS